LVGGYDGVIDGIYGPSTDHAIRAFELHEGSLPDGQFSDAESEALTREASAEFSRLGMEHVPDSRTGLSPYLPKALLTVTKESESGTIYSAADNGLIFETIRVQRKTGVSLESVLHSLEDYGDGSHVTYSKVTKLKLIAAVEAPTYSYYLHLTAAGSVLSGYRVAWTSKYAVEGPLISTFAFSPASPRPLTTFAPAPQQEAAQAEGERIGPFVLPSDRQDVIVLDGAIAGNAALDFIRALKQRPSTKTIWLNSPGGFVSEALLVAHEVRSRGLGTEVRTGMSCLSACSYVFFGGAVRTDRGSLGVHQIYGDSLSAEDTQMSLSDVLDALQDFGVSQGVISLMLRTPPDQMHVFSPAEIASLGIDKPQPAPLAVEAPPGDMQMTQDETIAAIDPASVAGSQSLLNEAREDGRTSGVPFSGTLDWSEGVDENGQPTLIGKANIPARNLTVDVLIRKNFDPQLPASHLMEINFTVSDSFIGGSIAGLPGVLLKDEELTQGTPLVGASARVVGNSFLFALSAAPEDTAANTKLLTDSKWMDLALIYASGKRAIITLEMTPQAAEALRVVTARPLNSPGRALTNESLAAYLAPTRGQMPDPG
jgi:peptidoglycan hydrolase-like protein with peptidoglycan-binding domain